MSTGPQFSSTPRANNRPPVWLIAGVLLTVAYVAWHLTGPSRDGLGQEISLGALTLICAIAVWAMSRSVRRSDLPVGVRRGLGFVTAGLVFVMLGSLYLVIQYLGFGTKPNVFGVVDALFMMPYPLSIIGLLYFPRGTHLGAGRMRMLIDGVAFVVGVGVPLWLFAIQPELDTRHGLDAVLLVAWPVMAFCGIFAVNASLLSRLPLPSRAAFWLMLAALGLSWTADLIFTLDAAVNIIRQGRINWINIANAISLAVFMLAAWRFQVDPLPVRRKVRPAAVSPVPMLTIVAVAAWSVLVAIFGRPDPGTFQHLLVCLILLLVVLLVRETLVLRDSLRLVAAEAQRESQARFEAMVRNSSDVTLVVDQGRRIVFASPASARALGVAPDELVGRDLLDWVHADDLAQGGAFFDQLMLRPDPDATRILRWRLRGKDGGYRHFETSGSNLLDEPTVGGFVLNSRDVTERTMLEERLHQAQKMEAIARLAGGVAHDFNNLLAVVLANSEMAMMSLPENHEARSDLEEIRRASTRGAALTGRLLAVGRRENLQPQAVDPAHLIRDTLPSLERALGGQAVLSIDVRGTPGNIRVDPHDLEQGLINLASNARDALPKTGGRVGISVRSETLDEPQGSDYLAAPAGRYVVVAVTDNGAGMDPATRTRLFEPFFTTKPRGKGAGLGLVSVFGLVKTAGGGIVVNSAVGQGTTVELWLPEVASPIPPAPATAKPFVTPSPLAGGEKILLVEDEDGVRRATQRILEAKGYRVLPAADAKEARAMLLLAEAHDVKLLLTDVIMPGQSGPVLAADVVRERPGLRVLFMSGYTGDELRNEGLVRAEGRVLIKPFTADELTARVQKALFEPAVGA